MTYFLNLMNYIGYSTLSNNKELKMKQEINWMTLWILITTSMGLLSLIYTVLSDELNLYGINIVSIYLLSSILPYIVWKYTQINFIQKQTMFMNPLHDLV